MQNILKLILLIVVIACPNIAYSNPNEEMASELLLEPQKNEIILQVDNDSIFDEQNSIKTETKAELETATEENSPKTNKRHLFSKKKIGIAIDSLKSNDKNYNYDEFVTDNNELDFEIFRQLDKNNDNIIDEDTLFGKIIHSKITRTDTPSYLLKDNLTFKYENGPFDKIQFYGAYRGSISSLFTQTYSTEYDNLTTQLGMYGTFKNPDYKFKFKINPIPKKGLNVIDNLIGDAYFINTSIPNHQIVTGYSRVQTGVEGGTSSYILPFVTRSQIARNFGSAKSLAVKVVGNYSYIDYNFAFGSSGRYITSGFPGGEFNGWINIKPFGSKDHKLGKLTIGGGFNGGHNQIDYSVGSVYVGYKHKRLWTNFEAAIADGYNGSKGISSNEASGFAATAGWKLNPYWQIIGRIDQFDPNNNRSNDLRREYSIGLNWFIKGQALRFIVNYVFCENQDRPDSHKLIFATQVLI